MATIQEVLASAPTDEAPAALYAYVLVIDGGELKKVPLPLIRPTPVAIQSFFEALALSVAPHGDVITVKDGVALRVPAASLGGIAGAATILPGLDDGGNPPMPGVVLQADIDALISGGVPETHISWYSIGTESASLEGGGAMTGVAVATSVGELGGVGVAPGAGAMTGVSVAASVAALGGVGVVAGAGTGAMTGVSVAASVGELGGAGAVVVAGVGAMAGVSVAASAGELGGIGLVVPTTPTITATPGDTQNVITLTSGGVGATSYDLKWGTVSGTRSNTISGVTLPYTHTGRTNGTTYYYSLVAINGAGSVESAEVSGTPVSAANFYTQTWDAATNGATSYDEWTRTISGANPTSQVNNAVAYNGANSWKFQGGDEESEGLATVSKPLTLREGNITFRLNHDAGSIGADTVTLLIGATVALNATPSADGVWQQFSYTVPAGLVGSRIVKFEFQSYGGAMWLDDISIPVQ